MTKAGFIIAPILAIITFVLWVILQIVQRGSDKQAPRRQTPSRSSNNVKLKRQK
jgi:hypothetical protein